MRTNRPNNFILSAEQAKAIRNARERRSEEKRLSIPDTRENAAGERLSDQVANELSAAAKNSGADNADLMTPEIIQELWDVVLLIGDGPATPPMPKRRRRDLLQTDIEVSAYAAMFPREAAGE